MKVQQTLSFKKSIKKLHTPQKIILDQAIKKIIENPEVGVKKKGDLSEVYIWKFKMIQLQMLLAYVWEEDVETLTLLKLGAHENFYRDLKNLNP